MVFVHYVLALLHVWGLLAPSTGLNRFFSQFGKQRRIRRSKGTEQNVEIQHLCCKWGHTFTCHERDGISFSLWLRWKERKRRNNIQKRIVILCFGLKLVKYLNVDICSSLLCLGTKSNIQPYKRIFCITLGSRHRVPPFQKDLLHHHHLGHHGAREVGGSKGGGWLELRSSSQRVSCSRTTL